MASVRLVAADTFTDASGLKQPIEETAINSSIIEKHEMRLEFVIALLSQPPLTRRYSFTESFSLSTVAFQTGSSFTCTITAFCR